MTSKLGDFLKQDTQDINKDKDRNLIKFKFKTLIKDTIYKI